MGSGSGSVGVIGGCGSGVCVSERECVCVRGECWSWCRKEGCGSGGCGGGGVGMIVLRKRMNDKENARCVLFTSSYSPV